MAIHVQGPYVAQIIYVTIVFFCCRCAALDLRDMDRMLGKAVNRALEECRITIPDACSLMKVNESNFRRALLGEGYRKIALNHLVKLGPEFMVHLTAGLMWMTAKQRAAEILETVQDMRRGA